MLTKAVLLSFVSEHMPEARGAKEYTALYRAEDKNAQILLRGFAAVKLSDSTVTVVP